MVKNIFILLCVLLLFVIFGVYIKTASNNSVISQNQIISGSFDQTKFKSDSEWKKILTPDQYHILREQGTEIPFTGALDHETRAGTYYSAGCDQPVFRSEQKYDSGTGWPSFWNPINPEVLVLRQDGNRIEVLDRCGGHLGHVFDDGPAPTGKRYCMNSTALYFIPDKTSDLVPPIADFKSRITKKFFGTFVSPKNSPVQPERFTGYHTGVDIEYTDVTVDVPVSAIAAGSVVTSEYASGYGGVLVLKFLHQAQTLYAVYGHLRPDSMLSPNSPVTPGQIIGVLGTGYSHETDGERRHLHFAIAVKNTITGYVSSKTLLNSTWINPLSLY
jgi:peptide-methionine (R)-S-oxide reductase